ncbi:lasso peptide biosynthesis B2 protein [Streptomyces sp. NPDC005438]|uniref:lasso peptide biosynthesis B2 protein n=1 Tax=Streptomyces sp. NPDC005438 TaxID=3156880 RepID=UPI0033AEB6B8
MTTPETIPYRPNRVPFAQRWGIRATALLAGLLARRSPQQIHKVLSRLRRGARPATLEEVTRVRASVVAASLGCAGREACLRRSLTVTLFCRVRGTWATWCVGPRTVPPFAAHAWVEAEGVPVGENVAEGYFQKLISVGPQR